METIFVTSYSSTGNNLGVDRNLDGNGNEVQYPEGTFATLQGMQHPELSGLTPHEDAARWEFYCVETGEILLVNEDGIIPS